MGRAQQRRMYGTIGFKTRWGIANPISSDNGRISDISMLKKMVEVEHVGNSAPLEGSREQALGEMAKQQIQTFVAAS